MLFALKAYPGRDQVRLTIADGQKTTELELPEVTTGYCAELQRRLADLVGEGGVVVEGGD